MLPVVHTVNLFGVEEHAQFLTISKGAIAFLDEANEVRNAALPVIPPGVAHEKIEW